MMETEPATTADDLLVTARLLGVPVSPSDADEVSRWLDGLLVASAVLADDALADGGQRTEGPAAT